MIDFVFLPGKGHKKQSQDGQKAAELLADIIADRFKVFGIQVGAIQGKYFNIQEFWLDACIEAQN